MSVTRRISGQLAGGLISIFGASIIAFIFMRVLPGDPARLIVGPLASQEAIEQQERAMGLDQPLVVQYWRYIKGIFTGDSFGLAYPEFQGNGFFLMPSTSPTDFFPIEQMQLMKFDGESWQLFGDVTKGEVGQ